MDQWLLLFLKREKKIPVYSESLNLFFFFYKSWIFCTSVVEGGLEPTQSLNLDGNFPSAVCVFILQETHVGAISSWHEV